MTSLDRIIFRICTWWRNRRLENAAPEIAAAKQAEIDAIRSHKPVKALRKRHQDAMTRALKGGV